MKTFSISHQTILSPFCARPVFCKATGDLPRASALLTQLYSRVGDGGTVEILTGRSVPIDPSQVNCAEFRQNPADPSRQIGNSRLHKEVRLVVRVHNEALTVAAMRVGNKDRPPVRINR
jgi:hypothetical protein